MKSTKRIGGNFVARERGLMIKDSVALDLHNARQGNGPGLIDYRGRRYPAGKSQLKRVSEGVVKRKSKREIMVEAYGGFKASWYSVDECEIQPANIVHAIDAAINSRN